MPANTFTEFLANYLAKLEPLLRDARIAYWNATISGKPEDFKLYAKLDVEIETYHTDKTTFAQVKAWHDGDEVTDPLERRQLQLVYRNYLRNQINPDLIEQTTRLSSEIVQRFNTHRTEVDGTVYTSNEVRDVLRTSTDGDFRRRVWEADKAVGPKVSADILKLVDLRNQSARALGYDNYYQMSLDLAEQSEDELLRLFDDLAAKSLAPFAELKEEVDAVMAARCGVTPNDLRPWHYEDPFCQEAPRIYDVNLDSYYAGRDIVALMDRFFAGIGLDVTDILERSDLFEKEGKEQHAYCIDMDRKGDIRVLANIRSDEQWTGTMLHELGHAVYDKFVDPKLPTMLREHAHIFCTEAIAMLFGRLSKDAVWMRSALDLDNDAFTAIKSVSDKAQRLGQLVFARWCQVMVRFESAMYRDPAQDLNCLWWDLVESYQLVSRPDRRDEPDWATKIHIATAPVYYHNYMLGELLASQLDNRIQARFANGDRADFVGQPGVGEFLRESVFHPGKRYRWDEMIKRATGEPLNPDYFVEQFVGVG